MSLDWETQRAFLAVLRTGSLSAAARMLAVAQPTVRRRLDALEAQLGVALFTRSSLGLAPTDAARRLLPHAEAMAAAADAFSRASSAGTRSAQSVVRITASDVIGTEVLPGLLAELAEAEPELGYEIVASNRTHDLSRQEADLAVRMTKPTQAALVTRKVGVVRLGAFATREYVDRNGKPRSLADANRFAWIGPDRNAGDHALVRQLGLDPAWRLRSDAHLVHLSAIRAGLGIGLCQAPLARRAGFVPILEADIALSLETWVVMHEDLKREPHVRRVFDFLVRALGHYVKSA